ncbi:NAD(P)H-dependent oxidoreductase subunit E [Pseudorhodoplanes sinuspersici]|uniref:NADH-quinone oxidoreductase subunit F n=1 Tax=Pseudorhodoplanes sinuspersici TaxID=1235591 RepID=A0A1W6ZRF7_9HYPH|nr:NAD(P)H-dependent oxidoreductase subunit E [Pseudorhodoplanes sinuspersici]ARP99855.1 NADH-quinone oxidoreductase subunit F [Pseudorhodoplanes sinuspersici]RKE70867.1 NAD-dependent formate dehydrogenase flavoprotein subunit [Pseudorhodoplanes sinuspersici]
MTTTETLTPSKPKGFDGKGFDGSGGRGRRARKTPKGRQVETDALEEIQALLTDRPRRRDLLIEHLHLIQDKYGHLSAAHLTALASEMKMALAEVYEVATFYAHFDVVKEGETPPPAITVRVCDSLSCCMVGAETLLAELPAKLGPDVRVIRAPCMGACDVAPVVAVGHVQTFKADVDNVTKAVKAHEHAHAASPITSFDVYRKDGGYSLLKSCLDGSRTREDMIKAVDDSGLRGLGGAGFPTGRKWTLVRAEKGPRLMAVNGDEGEPGTFKDRYYLGLDPHRFIEGLLLAAWVVEASQVYFYLRDEYPELRLMLLEEIAKVEEAGLSPHTTINLRRGAGAYICGEESAMIESIEGKRGLPRHRPPYVAQVGVFGRPTLVQNVETLYWIRDIVEKGASWFTSHGRRERKGLRSFSVSGRVKNPGVKLAPAGVTIRELIEEYSGGMQDGHTLKGFLPGGASGGVLPESMADIPLDFGTLEPHGSFVGSHAVVILSDQDDMKAVALNLMKFFEDESCGQCTPCRVGTEKAVKLMQQGPWNEGLLNELSTAMRDASICGLGQAAPNPLQSVMKHFPDDLKKPLKGW